MWSRLPEIQRNWIKEAEEYLCNGYARLGARETSAQLLITPSLDNNEALYFIRGLEEGLFLVDGEAYVQSQLLPRPSGKNTKQKMMQLFWTTKGGQVLFREGVCQLATVSSLILKYGWCKDKIIMEPGIAEFGKIAYGVDILIRDT